MFRLWVRNANRLVLGWLVIFLFSLSAQDQVTGQQAGNHRLYIRVVNKYGKLLPYVLDYFVNAEDKLDLLPRFNGMVGDNLPPGRYRYRLSRRDARVPQLQVTGEIELSMPEQWLTIVPTGFVAINSAGEAGAIDLGAVASRKPVIGRIRPAPDPTTPAWIRCQALFTRDYTEIPVTADGAFSVPGELSGAYMLIVMQGEHALQTQEVSFGLPGPTPAIEIIVSSRNGGHR
jgi:hypothetical protein